MHFKTVCDPIRIPGLSLYCATTAIEAEGGVMASPGLAIDLDEDRARLRSYMEAIERWTVSHAYFTAMDVPTDATMVRLTDMWVGRYANWNVESSHICYLETTNLATRESIFLPSHLFGRTPHYSGFSSRGCAVGRSHADALGRATIECLEQDALMGLWLHETSVTSIPLQTLDSELRLVAEYLFGQGMNPEIFEINGLDGFSFVVVFATAVGNAFPRFSVGSAGSPTRKAALQAAFQECISNLCLLLRRGETYINNLSPPGRLHDSFFRYNRQDQVHRIHTFLARLRHEKPQEETAHQDSDLTSHREFYCYTYRNELLDEHSLTAVKVVAKTCRVLPIGPLYLYPEGARTSDPPPF